MTTNMMAQGRGLVRDRLGLSFLICLHTLVCCASLVCIATVYPEFHIFYQPEKLGMAVAVVGVFALVSVVFVFADFSPGYFIGFYFYTMIVGYLWLNLFSEFAYDHRLAGLSAAASTIAFLLPALFIRSPLPPVWTLSPRGLDRLLVAILLLAIATLAAGASYNFRMVPLDKIYYFRDHLKSPTVINYLTPMTSNALLPFAFACFIERKSYRGAGTALLLMLCFYPITLSKLAVFTPLLLLGLASISRFFDLRLTVVCSLLAPMVVGVILFVLFRYEMIPHNAAMPYFGLVNFRTIAFPSLAMDYYNEFFFRHDLTYFCQISLLKPFVACPYQEQLAVVIYNAFGIGGNFNASLFATEGIASVGPTFAPVTALACGLVIGLANRVSSGLPPRFILVSSAIVVQILLNVPFTTVLLTHGAAILFLLWYIMPRTIPDGR